jgi:hypothetical protein
MSSLKLLDRVLDPLAGSMSRKFARAVLDLEFTKRDHARVESLSYKAQEGKLTPKEEAELDWYLEVNSLLIIMRAKAREALRQRRSPAA